ncbi:MAG TPA: hypothetical protein VFM94_09005 [Solirubrobacterales bacterium]|nr:hypothetical protein [Solirubrobacterales bacterium]
MTQSKTLARLLTAAVMGVLAVALLAPAAQAKEPAPGYEVFKGCPSPEEKAGLAVCLHSDITGGHLQTGSKDVPIENPLTLSGGADENFEGFTFNSKGGLTKVKQKVPGGVLGLTGLTWLLEFFGSDALTLYAETELAGTPSNFTIETVTIPIKVHLTTPSGVLGNTCYIGSNSSPITLKLTTGTTSPPEPNKPITGKEPELSIDGKGIIHLDNGTYVDNSFSVPGASGCVLKLFGFIPISLNGFVNSQSELPSAAGKNEAVQDFDLQFVERGFVYP